MSIVRASFLVLGAAAVALAADAPAKVLHEFLFPYDLGPAAIDVSSYPPEMRDRYPLVVRACSSCHTLARTLNAPYVSRGQWKPFAEAMHWKAGGTEGDLSPADERAILDFLVFDSRKRKVEARARFEAEAAALRARFEQVRRERRIEKNTNR